MSYYWFRLFSFFFIPITLPLAITSLISEAVFFHCLVIYAVLIGGIGVNVFLIWLINDGASKLFNFLDKLLEDASQLDKQKTIKKKGSTTHNKGELSVADTEGNISLTE